MNLANTQNTILDSIKYNLIIDETSENISYGYFINNLTKAGYKKTEINSADFQQITNLFLNNQNAKDFILPSFQYLEIY